MIFIGNSNTETDIVLRTTVAGSSRSVTPIGSGQAGDLCVILSIGDFVVSALSPPVGWSQGPNTTNASGLLSSNTFFKILDGSETSAINLHAAGGTYYNRTLYFTGGPTAPVAAGIDTENIYNGRIAVHVDVDPSGDTGKVVLFMFGYEPLATGGGFTMNPSEDATYDPNGAISFKYKIYNSSPQDTNMDIAIPSTDGTYKYTLNGFYIT